MKLTMMTRRISAALLAAVLCAAAAGCGVKVNPGTSDPQPDTPSSTTSDGSLPDSSADTSDEPTSGTDAASGTENSSRTSSSQGGTKATSGSSQSSGQSSGTKNFTEPVYDLGGRVIRVVSEDAAPNLSDGSIFSESVKLTQKKYNCTFKFIQKTDYFGTYETLITDHASQKASYDVVQLRGYDVYPNAAVSGAILEVDSVYDFKNDPTWQDANFKAMAKAPDYVDGKPTEEPKPPVEDELHTTFVLSGKVLDAQGKALANATVTMKNNSTTDAKTFVTDKDGQFRFDGVKDGWAELTVVGADGKDYGYITYTFTAVKTETKATGTNVDVNVDAKGLIVTIGMDTLGLDPTAVAEGVLEVTPGTKPADDGKKDDGKTDDGKKDDTPKTGVTTAVLPAAAVCAAAAAAAVLMRRKKNA